MWRFDICIYCELSSFSKTAHFQMVQISNLRTSLERHFSTSHTPPSSSIILSSPWSHHSTEITLNKFTMSLNPLSTQMFLVLISFPVWISWQLFVKRRVFFLKHFFFSFLDTGLSWIHWSHFSFTSSFDLLIFKQRTHFSDLILTHQYDKWFFLLAAHFLLYCSQKCRRSHWAECFSCCKLNIQ